MKTTGIKTKSDNIFSNAYTLAETLITLTLIGVIATLTTTTTVQHYNENVTVTKLQNFYSILTNGYRFAYQRSGPISKWGLTGTDTKSAQIIYEKMFKPHFNIAENCGTDNDGNCVINGLYKGVNNIDVLVNYGANENHYKVTLNDGSAVIFYATVGADGKKSIVFVNDVNGIKGPNQWGVDTFLFNLQPDLNKIIPFGFPTGAYSIYPFDENCQRSSTGTLVGLGCAAWVIYKGNMDYLHCDGLTWNSKSCKEK